MQAILDALFYVLKSGCPWRLLPREFPPWKTVYEWFSRWRIDGTWERLNAELRGRLRCRLGRDPNPSAGVATTLRYHSALFPQAESMTLCLVAGSWRSTSNTVSPSKPLLRPLWISRTNL